MRDFNSNTIRCKEVKKYVTANLRKAFLDAHDFLRKEEAKI